MFARLLRGTTGGTSESEGEPGSCLPASILFPFEAFAFKVPEVVIPEVAGVSFADGGVPVLLFHVFCSSALSIALLRFSVKGGGAECQTHPLG